MECSQASSLEVCVDMAKSGTPMLFLDVRPRPEVMLDPRKRDGRADMIARGKAAYAKQCDELASVTLADTLDACAIAYFHEILVGDGDSSTAELNYGDKAVSGGADAHNCVARGSALRSRSAAAASMAAAVAAAARTRRRRAAAATTRSLVVQLDVSSRAPLTLGRRKNVDWAL